MNSARALFYRTLVVLFAAVLLTHPLTAHAQQLSVVTSVSDSVVMTGETFTLQITVTSRVNGEIRVELPSVEGLTELSRRQSQSQSMTWSSAGQQVLVQEVYTIEYRADGPGSFVLGPVVARVGRRTARSTSVTVRVQRPGTINRAAPNKVDQPEDNERDLFLRYRLNRTEPYLGQAVLLDLEVISKPNQSFQVEETTGLPELEGFWSQILEQPRRLKPRRVNIGGRQYVAYRIWRAALYPLVAKQHTLLPVSMKFSQGGGLFRPGKRMRRRTKPIRIDVKPLPSEGRPRTFVTTNVGQYKLTASVDQRRVPAGKALLYTVRLSGNGNISSAKLPTIDKIPNFRVFAPTVRDQVKTSPSGISGYKEAEYLLMPQKGGRLRIPPVELTTFDPAAGKYKKLSSKALRVTVKGEPDPTAAPNLPPPTVVANDDTPAQLTLRPLRFTSSLSSVSPPPWNGFWFWLLLLAPGLASAGWAGYRWSRRRETVTTPRSVQLAASRQAQAAIEAARADVEAGHLAEAHAKIAEALRTSGSNALGCSLQGLTLDAVKRAAESRGLSAVDADDLVRLLEAADYARYAPSQLTSYATRSDIDRAAGLLETFQTLASGGVSTSTASAPALTADLPSGAAAPADSGRSMA